MDDGSDTVIGVMPADFYFPEFGRLAAMGVGFGLAGSWFLKRLISSLLYGTGVYSPVALVSATLAVSAAALLASYIPARHAAHINPAMALVLSS
ncbi:MAG TPA: hypothetical protein VNH18_35135 [Bryobacteraceae bacterium]|nr:hypothetical protein [Bryobacteraceae bacterium]HXJ44575.1 hypothetical protein [Bryobacteraceae bacterium]